jgi:hypothetical protein
LKRGDEKYKVGVLMEQFRHFGLFPAKFGEILDPDTVRSIVWLMQEIPQEKISPFSRTADREVLKKDKIFIGKIMKLDWRDRPTVKELLEDKWWMDDE